jgi:hypothetical protein
MQVYSNIILTFIFIFVIAIIFDISFYVNNDRYLCFTYTIRKQQFNGNYVIIRYSYKLFKVKNKNNESPF